MTVKCPVSLSSRAAHRRTLAAVEDLEVDAGTISCPAHQAIQGIDFTDQMAFANPANCRIAGHFTDRAASVSEQKRAGADPCGGCRCLAAGMSTTNDDDVELGLHSKASV